MGEPPRDARDGRLGGFGASTVVDAPVGAFAGMPHREREAMDAYVREGEDLRRGSYADAGRDTVTTIPQRIATERVASQRTLAVLLREAGLDPEAVRANVRAVPAGRLLVLADADADAAPAATAALDAV